jgi:hypothetical protein
MAEPQATCRRCGCELEGRDVYEGICRPCLEDEVLGGRARPRKPAPPPAAPKPQKPIPPPAAPGIDMDADTKELEVLPETSPEPPDPPAADDGAVGLAFQDETELEFTDVPSDDADTPADPPAAVAVDDVGDDEILPLTEFAQDDSPAPRAAPPAAGDEPPDLLRFSGQDAETEIPAAPPPPEPEPAPADEGGGAEREPEIRLRLDHLEPAPEPERGPAAALRSPEEDLPAAPARLRLDPELESRFRALEARVAELAARLDDSAARTGAGQVKLGVRFFLGMAVAAAVLGGLAYGVFLLVQRFS